MSSDTDGPQFKQWLDAQDRDWPDTWWHAIANWSLMDIFVIINGIGLLFALCIWTRYFWATRRMPTRPDAPTHGPWTNPRPKV